MGYKDEELLRLRQKAEEFNKQRVSEDTLAEELKESIHDPRKPQMPFRLRLPVQAPPLSLLRRKAVGL